MMTYRLLLSSWLIAASFVAIAETEHTQIQTLKPSEFGALFSGLDEVKVNAWENWGLTEKEWSHYQNILEKTAWGTWEHTMTPLQLLAIYSDSIEEKRRYARLEAKLDQWRQSVAFDYQRIYNSEREIIDAKYKAYIRNRLPTLENLSVNDKVAYFTPGGTCAARCVAMVTRLLKTGAQLDIYVIGVKTQEEVFEWATNADIPVDRVQARQITLNFEHGELTKITQVPTAFADIPVAYVKRVDGYERLAL